MNEITEKERGAIYLMRALGNTDKLNKTQQSLISIIGTDFVIDTERGEYTLKKFFGKFYYVYFN